MKPVNEIIEIVKKIFGNSYVVKHSSITNNKENNETLWHTLIFIDSEKPKMTFNLSFIDFENIGYTTTDYSEPEWSLFDKCCELESVLNEKGF